MFNKKETPQALTTEEWVDELIIQSANNHSSDIHFDPYE
jgi:type II secretory ATPase GspE/PulE/Tfp pilus assembly ATPase PilB-like protein